MGRWHGEHSPDRDMHGFPTVQTQVMDCLPEDVAAANAAKTPSKRAKTAANAPLSQEQTKRHLKVIGPDD